MADSRHSFMDRFLLTPSGRTTRIDRKEFDNIDEWLSPGDRIYWHRPHGMIHAAVVLATNQAKRKICVFERAKDDHSVIQIDVNVVSLDEQSGTLYRCDDDLEIVPLSRRLRIMLDKLGEKGYNLFGKNCQNLVSECTREKAESFQSKWFGVNLVMQAIKGCGKSVTAEMVEALFGGAEKIGVITIVVLQATLFLMEFHTAYQKLKDGNITWKHFVELVIRQFSMAIFSCVGSAVGGSLVGCLALEVLLAVILGVFAAHIAGMLLEWLEVDSVLIKYLGWVAGGILGFIGGFMASGWVLETLLACLLGFGGLLLGHRFGYTASWLFDVDGADSRVVNDLSELKKGDHITKYDWFLHPNCHAIFVESMPNNKMRVIGNSYREGVEEQILTFVAGEVYRYEYNPMACYEDDVVVGNALSKIGERNYSWIKCDCKAFATQCKCRQIRAETDTRCHKTKCIDWDAMFAKIISEPGLPEDKISTIEFKLQMMMERVSPIWT